MATPAGFGADAAYERAVAAYEQKSYDVARRWVLETLAQNPEHAQARTLLARLDSLRRPPSPLAGGSSRPPSVDRQSAGPETVSIDPTVLISHASRGPADEPIEPTVLVRREDLPRRPAASAAPAAPAAPRPSAYDSPSVSDPTVIRRPSEPPPPAPPPKPRAAAGAGIVQTWLSRWRTPPAPPRAAARARSAGLTPAMRGAVLAVGVLLVGALLVWAAIAIARSLWPAGQALTLTKPAGGTIVGPGLKCGTKGSDCLTTRPTGDAVELEPEADAGFVFSGFTGDCAPAGRLSMTEPRKCGATFDRIAAVQPSVTFPLTILKPVGGTIASDFDVLCGTLGTACAASVPTGTAVTMHFQADTGYTFQSFTNDCAPNGEMTMNAAKTCGATFMATSTPVANVVPVTPPVRPPPARRPAAPPIADAAAAKPPDGAPTGPPVVPAAPAASAPSSVAQLPTAGGTAPAPPPISELQHAKDEIDQLVKTYCSELETLKADRIQKIFPLAPMTALRDQFGYYKSLKCTITAKPEYDRLPDASASGASGAQIKFGMKQDIQYRRGGSPDSRETIVTMVVSRANFQSPWLIDRIRAEPKPK